MKRVLRWLALIPFALVPTALVPTALVPSALVLFTLGASTGCGQYDASCSTPGIFKCDFYVAAVMECKDFGGGKIEWSPLLVCPRGTVCAVHAEDPTQSCVAPGSDAASADAGDASEATDGSDGSDGSTSGAPDSMDGFVNLLLDVDPGR